jgi:sRNA-binding carbon storage regulator CsrA
VLGETIEVSFDAIRGKKIQISIVASREVAIMRSSSTQIGEQEEGTQCQKN